jgi:ribosomal protein S18 acetylase RimI-like enzyme
MAIHIRQAVEQDYEVYCDLLNEINELHRLALPGIFQQPPGRIVDQDYFLSLLNNDQAAIFFAEYNGLVAGFINVLIREAPAYPMLMPRRYGVVDTLVVCPAFQRTGVGRALMNQGEAWVAGQGVSELDLNVYEFNLGAQAFYRQLGYTTYSRKMSKKF